MTLSAMYTITSSIFIHFGHHVRGHDGPCISLHGHTWKFEITVAAEELDNQGFIVDFDKLQANVLDPCHQLLDHSLALGAATWEETAKDLETLGRTLVASRRETIGNLGEPQCALEGELLGARNERPGGIKVSVFPFTPTSERLAKWLFDVAQKRGADERVSIHSARVFETMHPTEFVAEYRP
ncbi:MAG: 6-carboxytetrahydropterin synthase [Myxococcales bacterium]|nr:6-carboxytetrahydropterin synthase [Myxococcales bacterium]